MVQNNKTSELRFTFIGMVFALAISNVGIQLSDFVNNGYSVFCYPDVLTHLFLFIFIIASSWIGWKNSNASGNKQDIADCFGISFIILLLDLFLVFCYFILVESVKRLYNAPDYKSEILWSLIIFIGYFFWDIITIFEVKNKNRLKIKIHWKDLLSDGYQSLTCAIILCLLYFLLKDNNPTKISSVYCRFFIITYIYLISGFKSYNVNLQR